MQPNHTERTWEPTYPVLYNAQRWRITLSALISIGVTSRRWRSACGRLGCLRRCCLRRALLARLRNLVKLVMTLRTGAKDGAAMVLTHPPCCAVFRCAVLPLHRLPHLQGDAGLFPGKLLARHCYGGEAAEVVVIR